MYFTVGKNSLLQRIVKLIFNVSRRACDGEHCAHFDRTHSDAGEDGSSQLVVSKLRTAFVFLCRVLNTGGIVSRTNNYMKTVVGIIGRRICSVANRSVLDYFHN